MGTEHFNELTPAEAERLAILAEEAAEVIHTICKIQRHGYMSTNPLDNSQRPNRVLLAYELGDLTAAIQRLTDNFDVAQELMQAQANRKLSSVSQYFHHQQEAAKP